MTAAGAIDRAVSDPIGLIVDTVTAVEHMLAPQTIQAVVLDIAGGRAKSRRLTAALAGRPEVLADGRSPAPRVVEDLVLARGVSLCLLSSHWVGVRAGDGVGRSWLS